MTEVTLNINSLILGFGLFRRKSWLYASSCISQVSHVTFVPPRCTRVVWTSGQVVAWQVPLSTRLENRTGFSQILKRRLLKPLHSLLILFSIEEENEIMSVLNWNDNLASQSLRPFNFIKLYTLYVWRAMIKDQLLNVRVSLSLKVQNASCFCNKISVLTKQWLFSHHICIVLPATLNSGSVSSVARRSK